MSASWQQGGRHGLAEAGTGRRWGRVGLQRLLLENVFRVMHTMDTRRESQPPRLAFRQ